MADGMIPAAVRARGAAHSRRARPAVGARGGATSAADQSPRARGDTFPQGRSAAASAASHTLQGQGLASLVRRTGARTRRGGAAVPRGRLLGFAAGFARHLTGRCPVRRAVRR